MRSTERMGDAFPRNVQAKQNKWICSSEELNIFIFHWSSWKLAWFGFCYILGKSSTVPYDYPVKILCNSVFFIKRVIRVLLILGSLSVCRILETLGKLTQNTYISIPLYKQFYGLFPLNLFYILGTFFLKLEIWKYTCIFSESCK